MIPVRRACAYVRVSREKEDGLSPEQQREKAELQARLMGLDLIRVYQDIDISGRSDQRPAFQEMIKDIKKKKYDVCLVYKLDRFCRNVRDFQHYVDILESHGCGLVSISQNIDTSTPVGRLLRNILADFAQFESEMIAERTRDNKISAAKKGRWNGGHIPYGFMVEDKRLVVNSDEAPVIAFIFELRGKGLGFHVIAKELTAYGYKPRHGSRRKPGHWTEGAVKHICRNPIYKGDLVYADVTMPGAIPAIVEVEAWEKSQVLRILPGRAQQSTYMLTGLLYCTHCNSMSWSVILDGRDYIRKADGEKRFRVPRYVCRYKVLDGVSSCPTGRLDLKTFEAALLAQVFSFADEKTFNEELKAISVKPVDIQADITRVRSELDNVRELMAELFSDYYDHRLITKDQFIRKNGDFLEREKLLMEKLSELQEGDPEALAEGITELSLGAKALRKGWHGLTQIERRIGLRKIIKRVEVFPDHVEVDFYALRKVLYPVRLKGSTMTF